MSEPRVFACVAAQPVSPELPHAARRAPHGTARRIDADACKRVAMRVSHSVFRISCFYTVIAYLASCMQHRMDSKVCGLFT